MDTRLFSTWQDRSLDGVIAKRRELVQDANLPTVPRWLEAADIFLSQELFSRSAIHNLFPQSGCFVPWQGFIFALQRASIDLAHD